jgi:hypothetical protein
MTLRTMHLTARGTALACALAVLVAGCAANPLPKETPRPSVSAHAEPAPSITPAPLATGRIPAPGQDVDTPVNGFDPPTVSTLCRAQMISDYPNIANYRFFAKDDIYVTYNGSGVNVQLPFGTLPDGRPEGIMVCAFTGTTAALVISYIGPVDV